MNKYRKKLSYITGVLFFTVLIFSGCNSDKKDEPKTAAPAGAKGPMTVGGFVLHPEKLDNIVRATGTVMANDEVELHAESSGRIIKIYFMEGSHVNKGDLLIKINDEDLQAQLKKNELQIQLTEQQLGRQAQLLKINATSQEEYDIVQNQLNTLQADRDVIKSSIDKTELRAPFTGIIGLRYVSEGSYVTSTTRIASIQNIDPVKVDFTIPEKYSGMVKKGDEVLFSSDATAQDFKGTVYAIEPKIDVSTRSLQIRALCPNANNKILPGSFANVELRLKENPDALMIPTQALIPVLKGQVVFVCKNGVAESVPVKTGTRTDVKVQITDGLSAGDTIITTGIMSLKPKVPVKVVVGEAQTIE